jgi:hypothetical protein
MGMTNGLTFRSLGAVAPAAPARWIATGICVLFAVGAASASVPSSNELGVRFKILRTGATATIEIRMTPRRDFDTVAVEAGSGVASLTPPCAFTDVRAGGGGTYVCQLDVTGKPSEAAMTLNVIARRAVPGGSVPVMEVHHLSLKNTAFALSQKNPAASHHNVADTPALHK